MSDRMRRMSDTYVPRVGGIQSADIAVPEHHCELRFYSRVLTTGTSPLWREDLLNNQGAPVIGLGASSAEYAHIPIQWMPHIQVADIAASVACAIELRGTELLHGRNDDGESQWAVLLDPHGAAFGIIPVVHPEAAPPSEGTVLGGRTAPVGRIAWIDLTVPEAPAACDFYRQVVGWSVQNVKMEDGEGRYADYGMHSPGGRAAAGICHARGVNKGLPPVWMLYLPVGDIAESRRRVDEEGGQIIKTTLGANGELAVVVVQDPVGASLALVPG